jgi:hypothetical protein
MKNANFFKKNIYLGPKRHVCGRLGPHGYLFGLHSLLLSVVGLRLAFVGLWGSKWVVLMMWVLKCIDGVLRRMAGSQNTWLRVGGSTIEKKHEKKTRKIEKKNTPMAQTTHLASFGLVVVVATPQDLLVLLKHEFNLENNS